MLLCLSSPRRPGFHARFCVCARCLVASCDWLPAAFLVADCCRRLPHLQVVRPRFAAGAPPGGAASLAAGWQRSRNAWACRRRGHVPGLRVVCGPGGKAVMAGLLPVVTTGPRLAVRTGMSHVRARSYQDRLGPGFGRVRSIGWRRAGRSLSGQPRPGCQPIIGPGPPPGSGMSGPGQVVVDLPGDVPLEDPDHLGLGGGPRLGGGSWRPGCGGRCAAG